MTFDDLIRTDRGYVTRAQFLGQGYNDRDIRSAVHAGLLLRRRHGIYVYAAEFNQLTPEQQHVVDVRSVADKLGHAVARQAPVRYEPKARQAPGRSPAPVRYEPVVLRGTSSAPHVGQVIPDDDLVEIDGMLVTKPARAMFETSTLHTVESAIVTLDSGLHLALTNPEELTELGARWWNWQGARKARYAMRLADGRAESPGESRSRYLFRRENLPIPDLQVPVHDENGRLIGYSDFGWLEYCHLGEFDGKVKYGGIPTDPRTPQQIAYDEKRREDAMRSQHLGMSRWGWTDINGKRGTRTAARVGSDLERSHRLYNRGRTIIPLD